MSNKPIVPITHNVRQAEPKFVHVIREMMRIIPNEIEKRKKNGEWNE